MSTIVTTARSREYMNQLKRGGCYKFLAIASSFLVVPVMINYLGVSGYGIWSTILSILSWIIMFDLGIGNGLRNKLSEAIANNQMIDARAYIYNAYVAVILFSFVVGILFLILSQYIPWGVVLRVSIIDNDEVTLAINISMFFVLLNFILSLINQVLNALLKSQLVIFNQFLAGFFTLVFCYMLNRYTESSISLLAFFFGLSTLASNFFISVWFYSKNKYLVPNFFKIEWCKIFSLLSLGSRFLIIQLAVIVLFTTDRIIITQLLGPEYVTSYDVVFKLFSIITVIHGVITAPLWNSYSDAYHRGDYNWIRIMMKKQKAIFFCLVVLTLSLCFFAGSIIQLWVGDLPHLDRDLIISLALFVLIMTWNNVFSIFLNGISETRLQVKTATLAIIINIPLSVFIVKYFEMGAEGVVLGTSISLLIFGVLAPLEVRKIFNRLNYE
ncbi:hypothetical protein VCSRO70_1868 [Vibrio cholerae]|nr:putative O-antigen flippase [Vibrio cholerae]GHY46342.1 hypothetical protein VCSRO70_1868 [Vibrio cholerae]